MRVVGEEFDVAVRSHRLHAQRFGAPSAPLVLGVHGLSGNMKNFDFVGERLGGDDLQLVALDLRGRGNSETTRPGTYGWENHALDVFAVADALGFERFSVVGQSMGGSVAMKAAELDGSRLDAVVLVDVAGRVDRGVGAVIASVIDRVDEVYDSVEGYLDAVKAQGLVRAMERVLGPLPSLPAREVDGGVRSRVDLGSSRRGSQVHSDARPVRPVEAPDYADTASSATQELLPDAGYVVPADDRDRFLREVSRSAVVEVDANHLTINTNPQAATAIGNFLAEALHR